MEMIEIMKYILIGTGLSFFGTILGSACVFFFNKVNRKIEKICFGFAAGIMMAASVWSLIMPAMEMTKAKGENELYPAVIGIALGGIFLLLLDRIIPHLHVGSKKPEGIKTKFEKSILLFLSVTLHNIPEGMAVGVAFAGAYKGNAIALGTAFALSLGMMIQNIPEGAAVALPMKQSNISSCKAFILGSISGIVEPIAGVITVLFISQITSVLPYFLTFAAGAMIYVVVEELIPESSSNNEGNSNTGVICFMVGFILMMILDITLG